MGRLSGSARPAWLPGVLPHTRSGAEATREASAPLVAGGLPPLENGGS
jgi:hypothetical protein